MPDAMPRLSFDRLAELFETQRSLPPEAVAALHRAFGELVAAGLASLIEPGAGTGRIALPTLAAGFHVTALDISPPMLATLRQRLAAAPEIADRCETVVGDAAALPFDDGTFDAGVLAQVLYLVPAWPQVLDELVRVVRPGGRVLLVQERTTLSPELAAWDAAWREAAAAAGYEPLPQVPDDATAAAALGTRVARVEERALATWVFGQTIGEALAGLDRLRPLYESLSDAAWAATLAAFRQWQKRSGPAADTRLDGTVTLTLVAGTVR